MPKQQQQDTLSEGAVEPLNLPSLSKDPLAYIRCNGTVWLLRHQLWDRVAQHHCSASHFTRYCQATRRHGAPSMHVGSKLMEELLELKVVKPRTGVAVVMTLAQALAALKKARVPLKVIEELRAAVSQPGLPVPTRGSTASTSGCGSFQPELLQFCDNSINTLPTEFPQLSLGQKLGLRAHQHAYQHPVLQQQLKQFQAFYELQINLARAGNNMATQSIQGVIADLLYILGYVHRFQGVEFPNLYHVVNAELVAKYMASRMHAGLAQGSMGHDLDALCKVAEFWKGQEGVHSVVQQQLQAFQDWVQKLHKQMRHSVPQVRKQPFAMQADGKWATASSLVGCFEAARVRIVGQVKLWQTKYPNELLLVHKAQELQDVLLVNVLFGYLPPMRLKCIMTMTRPSTLSECQEAQCQLGPECAGNRLERTAGGGIKVVFPHHKLRRVWGTAITLQSLPAELTELFNLYLDVAIPSLCTSLPKARLHERVFFTPTGIPHRQNLSYHFKRILMQLGSLPIAPQHLRHIFIEERRDRNPVAGPSDRGASLVMGNSLGAWAAWYDLSRWDGRAAQRAVDDMQPWRAAMLQGSGNVAEVPATQQIEASVMPENAAAVVEAEEEEEEEEEMVDIMGIDSD